MADQRMTYTGERVYGGDSSRLAGADSMDGQGFRDGFTSAQQNLIERALASHDSHNLMSDA